MDFLGDLHSRNFRLDVKLHLKQPYSLSGSYHSEGNILDLSQSQITTMSQDKSKDDNLQGDANTPPTYKEQLDEAAIKVKDPQNADNEGGIIGQVVEKGTCRYYSECRNIVQHC